MVKEGALIAAILAAGIAGLLIGLGERAQGLQLDQLEDPDCATLGVLTSEEARIFMGTYNELLNSRGQESSVIGACRAVHVRRWLRVQED